jgi:hypothetical protein
MSRLSANYTALLVGSLGFLTQVGGLFWLMSFYGLSPFSWFVIHLSFLTSNVLGHHIGYARQTSVHAYRYTFLAVTLITVCAALPHAYDILQGCPLIIPVVTGLFGIVCYLPLTHIWRSHQYRHIMLWLTLGEIGGLWLLWGIYTALGLQGITACLALGFSILTAISFTSGKSPTNLQT